MLRGYQAADDMLTSTTDPLMHEFNSLKNPQERAQFYARNFKDPKEMAAFRDKVAGMNHVHGNQ
jgi:hypothetical protein